MCNGIAGQSPVRNYNYVSGCIQAQIMHRYNNFALIVIRLIQHLRQAFVPSMGNLMIIYIRKLMINMQTSYIHACHDRLLTVENVV